MTGSAFRKIALSLPDATEQETWGEATFRVRGKIFATLAADGRGASIKALLEDQHELVTAHPEVFSIPHYVGQHGWVAVNLKAAEPRRIRDLVVRAWKRTAAKRAVAAFEKEARV